jgi:hypothetical protein
VKYLPVVKFCKLKERNQMKLIITFFILVLFTSLQSFSQDRIHRGVIPEKLTTERLREMHKPVAIDLQGLNYIESSLLKSQNNYWQTTIRNQQREFYAEEGFNAKDARTTINKTLLGNGFLLIEEIGQQWNGSAWVIRGKYSYTYDSNNNQIEELIQNWDGSAWVNYSKRSYTYDGNNNRTEQLYQEWDGSAWVDYGNGSLTYDSNNNLTEELWQDWDGSAWGNHLKLSYTYDGNNNQTEFLWQEWYGSAWVIRWKYSYTYDGNNNLTEELFQNWGVNSFKYSYTYDSNNNLIEGLEQGWDDSTWVNNYKSSYTYDGNNNQTERLYQAWSGSVWVNVSKHLSIYDTNNNLTEWLWQKWDGFAWLNFEKYSPAYDSNNNLIERLVQYWNGSAWLNEVKYSYAYIPVTEVNEDLSSINSYSLSNNYPNPFNPSTNITYTIPERSNVSLKVFDLLGSEVVDFVSGVIEAGSYDISFNASNLPSGIYFYKLQAGSFVETKKMILIK